MGGYNQPQNSLIVVHVDLQLADFPRILMFQEIVKLGLNIPRNQDGTLSSHGGNVGLKDDTQYLRL